MSASQGNKNGRQRTRLVVEPLEGRELLSTGRPGGNGAALILRAMANAGGGVGAPPGINPDVNLGAPTPAEAAKERFVSKLSGTFVTAPGRFVNQPLQGLILATGGSNQSLHLNAQFQFFLYSDPTVAPTGQIALSPKNVSSTGTLLLLDLTADPSSMANGLPTHYTFTVDSNTSGGLYSGASGQGTLDVHYTFGGGRSNFPRGRAIVVIQGTVVTNHGLTLDIAAPGNRTSNP